MGIVTRSGNLADAIQHLNALSDRLEHPADVLNQLGAALVTELAIRVPNATPYSSGTLRRGLGSFKVEGKHIAIGDQSFLEGWQKDAPEHTIGDFIRYMLENKLGYFSARWGGWKEKHLQKRAKERQRQRKTKERERQKATKAQRAERKRLAKAKKVAPKPKPLGDDKNLSAFGKVLQRIYRGEYGNEVNESFLKIQGKLSRGRVTYAAQMEFARNILRATQGLSKTQISEAEDLIRDVFQADAKREQKRATRNRATTASNKTYRDYSAKQQAKDRAGNVGGAITENEAKRQAAINRVKSGRKKK